MVCAALTGFSLSFNEPLNQASAIMRAYYQLGTVSTKKVKKKTTTSYHPIANFRVSYIAATDTVDLTLIGKQTFPTGGRLTLVSNAASGITGATGAPISGPTVFAISKSGKTITPSR